MSLVYYVSFDREGRIHTIHAMDESVLDTHPEKAGNSRVFLMRKGPSGESIPDEQLYRRIELHAGQRHYVEDGKRIKERKPITLAIDKTVIKPDNQDFATVTWMAPRPVQLFCNGRLPGRFNNLFKPKSKRPETNYAIYIDDPEFYSETIWLRTETTEHSTSPAN